MPQREATLMLRTENLLVSQKVKKKLQSPAPATPGDAVRAGGPVLPT